MFVNFKPLIKRIHWIKRSVIVKSNTSRPTQISVHSVDSAAACSTSEESSVPAECVSMETKCYFCGNKRHPRFKCPARDRVFYKCKKKRHFSSVCLSESKNPAPTAALTSQQPSLYAASPVNSGDDKVNVFALLRSSG